MNTQLERESEQRFLICCSKCFGKGNTGSHGDTGNRHSTTTGVKDKERFLEEVTSKLRPEESVGGSWVKREKEGVPDRGKYMLRYEGIWHFLKNPVK